MSQKGPGASSTTFQADCPDGFKALADAHASLAEAYGFLQSMYQFWKITSQQCQALLSSQLNHVLPELQDRIWREYRDAALSAVSQVVKYDNMILIEPPVPHPNNRRGSDFAATASPLAPRSNLFPSSHLAHQLQIVPPQQSENYWDDEEVKSTCWSSLFFSSRRRRSSH